MSCLLLSIRDGGDAAVALNQKTERRRIFRPALREKNPPRRARKNSRGPSCRICGTDAASDMEREMIKQLGSAFLLALIAASAIVLAAPAPAHAGGWWRPPPPAPQPATVAAVRG